jgi:hypothetical protein
MELGCHNETLEHCIDVYMGYVSVTVSHQQILSLYHSLKLATCIKSFDECDNCYSFPRASGSSQFTVRYISTGSPSSYQ